MKKKNYAWNWHSSFVEVVGELAINLLPFFNGFLPSRI